jgi:translocator protein
MLEIASKSQLRWAFLRAAAISVPLLLALASLSARIGGSADSGWYESLTKPGLTPSPGVFPVAWTLLYLMMGFAIAIIWHARGNERRYRALYLFCGTVLFSLLWSPVFFGLHRPGLALIVIVPLLALLLMTAYVFYRVRKLAGLLIVPTLVWVMFATYLNTEIWRLNPDASTRVVRQHYQPNNTGTQPEQSPGVIPL